MSHGKGLSLFLSQSYHLTRAQLRVRYRRTVGGFLWVIMNPLISFGVQAVIFSQVLKLDISRYPLFLLSGLFPWILIVQTLEMSAPLLVNSSGLIRGLGMNPRVILASQVLENAVNFLAVFVPVAIVFSYLGWFPPERLLLIVPYCLVIVIGVYGLASIISILQIFFRDVRFILTFAISVGYFATPVFYPLSYVPESWRRVVLLNPAFHWIDPIRSLVYEGAHVQLVQLLPGVGISVLFVLLAEVLWNLLHNKLRLYA